MQHLPFRADPFGQYLLDKHMNVFRLRIDLKIAVFKILQDTPQSFGDMIGCRGRKDALLLQHRRMGNGTGDILTEHPCIDPDR